MNEQRIDTPRRLDNVQIVTYESAADIVAVYVSGHEVKTWADLESAGFTIDGACIGMPGTEAQHDERYLREIVVEIQGRKSWGFQVGGVVHLWISIDATLTEVASLIGHELGHAQRDDIANALAEEISPENEEAAESHTIAEEHIANTFGEVVEVAVRILHNLGLLEPVGAKR